MTEQSPARFDIAVETLNGATGTDLGDELRKQAEHLAYRAAKDYERALRQIETHLVSATDNGGSQAVRDVAIDVVRTHMVRGLLLAQIEAGDKLAFWVRG